MIAFDIPRPLVYGLTYALVWDGSSTPTPPAGTTFSVAHLGFAPAIVDSSTTPRVTGAAIGGS